MISKTVKIGGYTLNGLWLAPMAGYTDIAFRELCREYGAGLTVTDMVSVRGLVRDNAATAALMRVSEAERPSCVQIFGSDPEDFKRAASMLDCDIIDVNMGCPMPKIVKNGDGSALLLDAERAGKIVSALVQNTDKPVTVKTRLGYHTDKITAGELIDSVQKAGASAVTLHGRFAEQRYAGSSDVSAAAECARRAGIPVLYNGDVTLDMLNDGASALSKNADAFGGVAVGRYALEDPAVFCGGNVKPFEYARKLIGLLTKYFDERYTVNQARKFFVHVFKGVAGGKALRLAANEASSSDDILRALDKTESGARP